jgi:copper chaperone CopZ
MTIEREVGEIGGVEAVKAESETKRVTISWDPDATDWVVIEDTMKEINFPPAD